jgi:hypothetical protein
MNDYPVNRRMGGQLERRIDEIVLAIYHGSVSRPQGHFDTGTGSWVVLDQCIEFGTADFIEVKRGWLRANWFAYEPSVLGLTMWLRPKPGWNDAGCVVRPRHEHELRAEYPKRVLTR